jgi:hypothetical protein
VLATVLAPTDAAVGQTVVTDERLPSRNRPNRTSRLRRLGRAPSLTPRTDRDQGVIVLLLLHLAVGGSDRGPAIRREIGT